MLRVDKTESGFSEKALVILMDNKLIMNWQCTLIAEKANSLLGCVMKSVARRSSRVIFSSSQPGGLCPVLDSSLHEIDGLTRMSPLKGHKDD